MGRKRKNNPLGLPERTYANHGAYFYVHPGGRWERLGNDLAEAIRKGVHYNDPAGAFGTMPWYLDQFIMECDKRVTAGNMAPRTASDYRKDVQRLKVYLEGFVPPEVQPKHVTRYLEIEAAKGRPVKANREKAALSACFSWLLSTGQGGAVINPCLRQYGVRRNPETERERYVTNDELALVRPLAHKNVKALLDLVYRTLQRPEDIILWTRLNIVKKTEPNGSVCRVVRSKQGKTGARLDIEISPEIDAILVDIFGTGEIPSDMPLIHRRDGHGYTYDGLCAMLKRSQKKARKAGAELLPFGFYDMKAKGATDMWLSGVALERIQVLCGHESVTTTEIYVKRHWQETVSANRVNSAA